MKEQIRKVKDWYNEVEIITNLECEYYPNKNRLRKKALWFYLFGLGFLFLEVGFLYWFIPSFWSSVLLLFSVLVVVFVPVALTKITHSYYYQEEESEKEEEEEISDKNKEFVLPSGNKYSMIDALEEKTLKRN